MAIRTAEARDRSSRIRSCRQHSTKIFRNGRPPRICLFQPIRLSKRVRKSRRPGWSNTPGFARGYGFGRVGISSKHALAIVNRGGASADEILALKDQIQQRVEEIWGVRLEPEPVMVGF